MPTVSLFEVEALRAVRDHRWFPTQTIADALGVPLPTGRSILGELRRFGLVDNMGGPRSSYLGEQRWALTRSGEAVLVERLPALERRERGQADSQRDTDELPAVTPPATIGGGRLARNGHEPPPAFTTQPRDGGAAA